MRSIVNIAPSRGLLLTAIVLLSAGVFAADLINPDRMVASMLYPVLVVLTLRLRSQVTTILVGIAATGLTVLAQLWVPHGEEWSAQLPHRALVLFALWLTVHLCLLYQRTEHVLRSKEHVLAESGERFRQLAEHITEVFWLTDPEMTRMLYISPGYEAIWGRSCEGLYASPRSWLEAIHDEDRDRILKAALTKQVSGTYDEEYRIVRPEGTIRWVWDRAFPVLDDSGQVYRIAGIAQDITERKLAEEALRESEERFRSIAEASPVPLGISRATDGLILYANEELGRLLGARSLLGRRSLEFYIDPGDQETLLLELARDGFLRNRELRVKKEDGTLIWVMISVQPMTFRGEDALLCGFYDISDRKRAEQVAQASEQQLRELLEARERLARDLHDHLIQSLFAIGLSLGTCRRLIGAGGEQAVQRLDDTIARLNAVIHDVRNYIAGLELELPVKGEFSEALGSLVRTMNDAGPLRWEVETEPAAADGLTAAERIQLLHILREAMSNSVRHSRGRHGRVSVLRKNGRLRLTVQDDGVGFLLDETGNPGHGLRNMAARASLIGAQHEIRSKTGMGTSVVLTIA